MRIINELRVMLRTRRARSYALGASGISRKRGVVILRHHRKAVGGLQLGGPRISGTALAFASTAIQHRSEAP
jgi:hypothetical protein